MLGVVGLLALIAAWGAVAWLLRAILRGVDEHRLSVAAVATTLVMVAASALVGRLTEDLRAAVALLALLAGLLAVPVHRMTRGRVPNAARTRMPIWALALAGTSLLLVGWAAVQGHFWDENAAHFAVSNAIARGLLPPEHPLFPGEPFRYHYGFNVLVAHVRAFTGWRVTTAIDLVTTGCFALLLATAADFGRALANHADESRAAGLAMVLVPLGAGTLQYLLFRDFGAIELRWDALPDRWLQSIPPPVISNFFQHPQGLAMPCALGVMMLFDDTDGDRATARRVIAALLLGPLALAHVVYFGVLGLALGAAVLVEGVRRDRPWSTAIVLVAMASALLIAVALGGFFAPGGQSQNLLTLRRDFFSEPFAARAAHHVVLFGLPLLALPFAVARLTKRAPTVRGALLVAVAVGFVIPNVMSYGRSWDIVKFLGVAAFFANLLLADALATVRNKAFVAVIVALTISTSSLWLIRTTVLDGRAGISKMHFQSPPEIAYAVAEQLGPLVGPRQRVLSTNIDISKGAGLLTPGFDWRQFGSGYMMDRARCDRLTRHLTAARRTLAQDSLQALDVDFVILGAAEIPNLLPATRAALDDPQRFEKLFEVRASDGHRHVWRIVHPEPR